MSDDPYNKPNSRLTLEKTMGELALVFLSVAGAFVFSHSQAPQGTLYSRVFLTRVGYPMPWPQSCPASGPAVAGVVLMDLDPMIFLCCCFCLMFGLL